MQETINRQESEEVKIFSMSEVQSREVSWLWYPYIPYGKLTIIQGDPGEGKTTFVLNLAAKLSKGLGFETKKCKFFEYEL